jgi:glucose/arabinose dehydrogenase
MHRRMLGLVALMLVIGCFPLSLAPIRAAPPTGTPVAGQTATTPLGPLATPDAQPGVRLRKVVDGLIDPVNVRSPRDGSGRLFIVEKIGRILIWKDGKILPQPFLDITGTVTSAYIEQGLFDIAFHPDFVHNGLVYVSLTHFIANGALTIFEYHVDPAHPEIADPASQRVILVTPRSVVFHNGGTIAFGPDGYLYVGVGDGAPPYDVIRNRSEDLTSFDGKILRIDVNRPRNYQGGFAYGVPKNPFGGPVIRNVAYHELQAEGKSPWPEIWAYGLRNPWHFSFDPKTGDLWIPDVGQDKMEELNLQPAGSAGGQNYGWRTWEGTICQNTNGCAPGSVAPIATFPHQDGLCSITGLGVYRGTAASAWDGDYFYGDFCTGNIWRLTRAGQGWTSTWVANAGPGLSGSGYGPDGELYITTCTCTADSHAADLDDPALKTGTVWKLEPLTAAGG